MITSPEISIDEILYRKFSVFYAPITNKSNFKDLDLITVYNLIKSEKLKNQTIHLRTLGEPEKKTFKNKAFPHATFSGTFSYCSDKDLIKHSGLICIDLDNLENELNNIREFVNNDIEYTIMSFISPSGNGLKILYRIEIDKNPQKVWYEAYCKRLCEMCKLPEKSIDWSCQNVSRGCFLPHDSEIFINPRLNYNSLIK